MNGSSGYHSTGNNYNNSAATTASTNNANRTANGLTKSLGEDSVQRILKKSNPKGGKVGSNMNGMPSSQHQSAPSSRPQSGNKKRNSNSA